MRCGWRPTRAAAGAGLVAMAVVAAACGKKGPPLPPLRPLPARVADLTVRRADGRIVLRFTIPSGNADNSTPPAIGRVDIYARSAPAGSPKPVPEQIVMHAALLGSIAVRPPAPPASDTSESTSSSGAKPQARPEPAAADPRPAPGDAAVFVDPDPDAVPAPLPAVRGRGAFAGGARPGGPPGAAMPGSAGATPPVPTPGQPPGSSTTGASTAAPPSTTAGASSTTAAGSGAAAASSNATAGRSGAAAPQGAASAPATPAKPLPPTRYFMVTVVSRHGQLGQPSDLVAVPLVPPPPPVHDLAIDYDEKTLTASWKPGDATEVFTVYEVDADGHETTGRPLSAPLKDAAFHEPVVFGKARCLAVRGADVSGPATAESEAVVACATPVDHFPPATPGGLAGFSDAGVVTLRWDPVDASDLAGYLVLRGESGSDTLQQLTPSPIVDTTFRDTTGRVAATYTYTVVAVDTAKPPNRSPSATPVTVTVR